MNVYLTPEELLHVYQIITASPHSDVSQQRQLLGKIKKPLLDALEKEEDRLKDKAYLDWSQQEEKKIQSLRKEYLNLWPGKKPNRRK